MPQCDYPAWGTTGLWAQPPDSISRRRNHCSHDGGAGGQVVPSGLEEEQVILSSCPQLTLAHAHTETPSSPHQTRRRDFEAQMVPSVLQGVRASRHLPSGLLGEGKGCHPVGPQRRCRPRCMCGWNLGWGCGVPLRGVAGASLGVSCGPDGLAALSGWRCSSDFIMRVSVLVRVCRTADCVCHVQLLHEHDTSQFLFPVPPPPSSSWSPSHLQNPISFFSSSLLSVPPSTPSHLMSLLWKRSPASCCLAFLLLFIF